MVKDAAREAAGAPSNQTLYVTNLSERLKKKDGNTDGESFQICVSAGPTFTSGWGESG